ncbi:hypothetical protein [uncultured Rhodoblastus sp.]|uniref:hypothetical protein n=1 Tax=uncultured Rhodoblastus sp. TaxID=543037 RepID=UPI0025D8EFC5|nr:hypothetical protein [uncultured Rhodoblastus sp.]
MPQFSQGASRRRDTSIRPIRKDETDESDQISRRLYGMLPRLRVTELLAEVHGLTEFAARLCHWRAGAPPEDDVALMTAPLADANNPGLPEWRAAPDRFGNPKTI